MGRNALSIRMRASGRGFLRFVPIAALMLASSSSVAFQRLTTVLEQEGRAAANDRRGITDDHCIPRVEVFHLAPQAPQQPAGQSAAESQGGPKTFVDMTPAELARAVPELRHLEAAESQNLLPLILERVGATVVDFYDNFSNTTCTEHVISSVDTPLQTLADHYDANFNYVALVKEGADNTRLREFRTDSKGELVGVQSQDAVITIGFVGMAAHFHPEYQADSRFRYVGREVLEGQKTYVVSFAQRPDVARHVGGVEFNHKTAIVFLQGVAWIDPVSFRILRLQTDLQHPELNVGLQRETTQVEYSEMTFKQGGKTLWLPREVTVSGKLDRYVFRNRHAYSNYRLFLVQIEGEQKNP